MLLHGFKRSLTRCFDSGVYLKGNNVLLFFPVMQLNESCLSITALLVSFFYFIVVVVMGWYCPNHQLWLTRYNCLAFHTETVISSFKDKNVCHTNDFGKRTEKSWLILLSGCSQHLLDKMQDVQNDKMQNVQNAVARLVGKAKK